MNANPSLLQVRHVNTGYGKLQVLWDVDIDIPEGTTVGLLGANGSGKSTLLRSIMGLLPLWSGEVILDGERINDWDPSRRVRASMSYMSEKGVMSQLSVEDNLRIGGTGLTSRELKTVMNQTWDDFPLLSQRRRSPAGSLSGGQRKTLALAKALMRRPRLLIMDEPSSGLSPILVKEMVEMLMRVRDQYAVTLLLAEQNSKVLDLAQRIVVITGGRKGFDGPIEEFRTHTDVAAQFFGLLAPDAPPAGRDATTDEG